MDTGKQIIDHRKHRFGIQEHKCLFVVGSDIMRSFDNLFHSGVYVGSLDSMFHGETDHVNLPSQIVSLLHGSKRKDDCLRRLSLYAHVSFGSGHSDDLIINSIHTYVFATRIFARLEKTLINSFPDNAHFAVFLYIYIIDIPAVCYLL